MTFFLPAALPQSLRRSLSRLSLQWLLVILFTLQMVGAVGLVAESQVNNPRVVFLCGLTLFGSLAIGALMVRGITRPILQRNQAAQQMADGSLATSILIGEIGEVIENLAGTMPGNIYAWVVHPDGSVEFEYTNQAIAEILEADYDAILQHPELTVERIHPDDLPAFEQQVAESAKHLQPFQHQWRIVTPSGKIKFLQGYSRPEQRANGDVCWYGVVLDISDRARLEVDRKQTEEALSDSEARFQKIAAAVPGEIYILVQHPDGTFEFEYMSPGCRDIQELEPEEVLKSPFLSFDQVHPDDQELMYARAAESGEMLMPFSHEWRIITPSGKTKWVQVSARPERRKNGDLVWYGILLDVSSRKQAEAALRESEERLRIAFEAAQLGTWDWNILTGKVVWSENMERMFGMEPGTFDGSYEMFQASLHPEDREFVLRSIQDAITSGQDYGIEFRILWPDASVRWAYSKGRVFYDGTGVPTRMAGIDVDITQRKQAEATLRQSEVTNRALIRAIPDLMIHMDRNGNYLAIYPSSTVKLIDPEKPRHGVNIADILPRALAEERIHYIQQVLEQGNLYTYEYQITIDNELHYEEARIAPCGENEVLIIIRDISDRYRVERIKNEFISVVSHELRTPLTAINGSLGLLNTGKFATRPDQSKELIKLAFDNSSRLVRLVNDILDLERLESGQVELIKELCQIEMLMRTAVESVQTIAEQANIALEVSTVSADVLVAPDQIVQTLVNLLSNAIKFSAPEGTVSLKAEVKSSLVTGDWSLEGRQESGDQSIASGNSLRHGYARASQVVNDQGERHAANSYVLFSVTDRGRGIPANKLETIFERFQQVDASDSRQKGGTGLGLAICKSIVEKHQGRIWVESIVGEGSTFYFTLPLTMPEFQSI